MLSSGTQVVSMVPSTLRVYEKTRRKKLKNSGLLVLLVVKYLEESWT
jgi:hypothetical protein